MQTALTRLWSAWARHPEYGVNAQLAQVDRHRFDGSEDPVPPPVTVYDDIDDAELSLELDPPTVPALVVFTDSDVDANLLDPHYLKTGDNVIVMFAYITREVPPRQAVIDGGYVMQAVRRMAWRMNDQRASRGYRELAGIKLAAVKTVSLQRVAGGVGRSELWGLAMVQCQAIDTNP